MTKEEFLTEVWKPSLAPLIKTHTGYPPNEDDREHWYRYLKRYSVKTVSKAMIGLTLKTDYQPTVKMLADECDSVSNKKSGNETTGPERQAHDRYIAFLKRYDAQWRKFYNAMVAGTELPDDFKKAKRITEGYVEALFGKRNLKQQLSIEGKQPYVMAYRGLFCEALAGKLKPLSIPSKVNLSISLPKQNSS